jgi:hypothetical protein
VILGQQTGHGLEFSKIQSENCFHGRESLGSKELKRVYLNILPNSAFGCPTHDLHGFSYFANAKTPSSTNMQQLEPRQNAAATKIPEEPKIHAYFCNPCFFQKNT